MAILASDVKLYESQKLVDEDDGGGRATGNVIIDGDVNNLFADISRLDRTIGDVSLRKTFVGVATNNDDTYLGAHAIIAARPADPNVHVLMFNTDSETDTRENARNRIESYVVRGTAAPWYLFGDQFTGQRMIVGFQRLEQAPPEPGEVYELLEGATNQFIRVTEVDQEITTWPYTNGQTVTTLTIRRLEIGISAPLNNDYDGGTPAPAGTTDSATKIYSTQVADASQYFGITALAEAMEVGDLVVPVDSVYAHLVPSAQSESPLVDLAGFPVKRVVIPAKATNRSESASVAASDNGQAYTMRPIVPGTLTLTLTNQSGTWEDNGQGGFTHQSGSNNLQNLAVDYESGLITWYENVYTGTLTMTLDYQPGAVVVGAANTGSFDIVANNRSYSYSINLATQKPRPGSFRASYMALGKWQDITDRGDGVLEGVGSGSINFTTGTVLLTFEALPDVGTAVMYSWVEDIADEFGLVAGNITQNPTYEFALLPGVEMGSVSITFTSNGTPRTVTDSAGTLTGDATGLIAYSTGQVRMTPGVPIDDGTNITIDYELASTSEQAVAGDEAGGYINFDLPDNVQPGSLLLTFQATKRTTQGRRAGSTTVAVPYDQTITRTVMDNGAGALKDAATGAAVLGSINYTTGAVQVQVERGYTVTNTGSYVVPDGFDPVTLQRNYQNVPYSENVNLTENYVAGSMVAKYQPDTAVFAAQEDVIPVTTCILELLSGATAAPIIPGSVLFTWAGKTYYDRDSVVYTDFNDDLGAGVSVGSIDYNTGRVTLQDWPSTTSTTVAVVAMATEESNIETSVVTFRTPAKLLRPGSFNLTVTRADTGTTITAQAGNDGKIQTAAVEGFVNVENGQVLLWFTSDNTTTDGSADIPILPATLRYTAISYAYIPLDADLIGVDPVRLPSDGRVPIFRDGDVLVIAHTAETNLGTPTDGQVVNLARDHQASIEVRDANGVAMDPAQYTVNLALGRITFANPVTLQDADTNALTTPLAALDRIEHMALATDVQVNGQITIASPTPHAFPADETVVSSALVFGDIWARVYNEFTQKTWNGGAPNWTSARIGDDSTASYNLIDYPIAVVNAGAITEKWALVFTSTTAFQIVGQERGIIGTGSISTVTAPMNPNTGSPYFTIAQEGWGSGWVSGNVLRFDTDGCLAPMWIARTVLAAAATFEDDTFVIQVRGDAD